MMKKFYFTSIAVEESRKRETLEAAVEEAVSRIRTSGKEQFVWELKRVISLEPPPVKIEEVE